MLRVLCVTGERYDFVIEANNIPGAYWIQVRGLGECGIKRAQQLGILRYARGPYQPSSQPPTYDVGIPQGVVSLNGRCNILRYYNVLYTTSRFSRSLIL